MSEAQYPHWLDADLYLEVAENVINGMTDEEVEQLTERQIQVKCLKVYHQTARSATTASNAKLAANPFDAAARQLVRG